jgi:hypothetical protein
MPRIGLVKPIHGLKQPQFLDYRLAVNPLSVRSRILSWRASQAVACHRRPSVASCHKTGLKSLSITASKKGDRYNSETGSSFGGIGPLRWWLLPPSASAPASGPTASKAGSQKPNHKQKQDGANSSVDDCGNNSSTKMDTDLRQRAVANEGANNAYYEIADESETGPRTICPSD